jgi:hypothetical protein
MGQPLTFTVRATDSDIPANVLTFSLRNTPAGASIDTSTGVFTWTPTEEEGPGSYNLTVRVTDNGTPHLYAEEAITITVTINQGNMASGRPAVGSTTYPGYPAGNITDGDTDSRWSSLYSDNEWLYVDLGSAYTIDRVVMLWTIAYARSYKLQVSNDAVTWSDVYSTTAGVGGTEDITLASPASGRYVRLLGIQRATQWGYSLWEFEVY